MFPNVLNSGHANGPTETMRFSMGKLVVFKVGVNVAID